MLAHTYGARSAYCAALGAELRARRLAGRLSQRALGSPLSAAYVSSVEIGRVIPSLPALLMMLDRLGVSAPIYFEAVNCRLRPV
jgi:transcriptional regulator with XRE-family HTH domain